MKNIKKSSKNRKYILPTSHRKRHVVYVTKRIHFFVQFQRLPLRLWFTLLNSLIWFLLIILVFYTFILWLSLFFTIYRKNCGPNMTQPILSLRAGPCSFGLAHFNSPFLSLQKSTRVKN